MHSSLYFSPQLHIVHMKSEYADLTTALRDSEGVAVLGFFYEVAIESPEASLYYGPDLSMKQNSSHRFVFLLLEIQQRKPKV